MRVAVLLECEACGRRWAACAVSEDALPLPDGCPRCAPEAHPVAAEALGSTREMVMRCIGEGDLTIGGEPRERPPVVGVVQRLVAKVFS
jgi:hypothetical protein